MNIEYYLVLKNLRDFNVKNKRVLVRCDFNVPLDKYGNVADDFKIARTLPTLKYLIKNKAKIVLMSHLDNPDNTVTSALDAVRDGLEALLNVVVKKTNDCVGAEVESEVSKLQNGEILLLENLRLNKEEFENNHIFAKNLAKLGEVYINDAFSVCHRSHASVIGVPKYLPHGAGFLLEQEIKNLDKVLKNPKRPVISLIGGRNAQTKAKFINNVSNFSDFVLINSLINKEIIEKKIKINHPEKIIGPKCDFDALDIGDEIIGLFVKKILEAKTILWNGPFGKFEDERYEKGTLVLAKAIIKSRAFSVVGGGDTVGFLNKKRLTPKFSYVCTGGGAMLAYLAGETLPGLEALEY